MEYPWQVVWRRLEVKPGGTERGHFANCRTREGAEAMKQRAEETDWVDVYEWSVIPSD